MRKKSGVASNELFWSALVDVYARSGDYRGAEGVLDEILAGSGLGRGGTRRVAVSPLLAYTSFFAACHKRVARASYEHREYGQDTRPLAALLLAHGKAMEGKGFPMGHKIGRASCPIGN